MPERHSERALDSIIVGVRHRKDLGDIDELAESIRELGMLQPITITPDGVLVCGRRRLEAVRRLGWHTVKVWIRSGISGRLTELLSQQDENNLRQPLSPIEQADLYKELKELYAEDAKPRQEATQFGGSEPETLPGTASLGGVNGDGHCPSPQDRGAATARNQAAKAITGDESYHRLERINFIKAVARDPLRPVTVRELAATELAQIEAGGAVSPGYSKIRAALELAGQPGDGTDDAARLADEALARVRQAKARSGVRALQSGAAIDKPKYRTLRSFLLTWTELEGWSQHYDADQLAEELSQAEYERFVRVVEESVAFCEKIRTSRRERASATA